MITLAYITSRIDPKLEWFISSLAYQCSQEEKDKDIELIIVDRLVDGMPLDSDRRKHFEEIISGRFQYHHVAPKPSVWQGLHRLTKEDWFAASNARNTALIQAQGDFIAFVDDLSVLTGAWWKALQEARQQQKVTCGAYRKVKNLHVDDQGNITHFDNFHFGIDNRWAYGNDSGPIPCSGNWLYGCSFACPVRFLLEVNGLDEDCDGLGFEDCILGIRMANNGYQFQYDRRLLTYEAEELHHLDKPMRRTDKGVSPHDKSHALLKRASETNHAENIHFGTEGIMGLRKAFEETGKIPVPNGPIHDWYDGQSIADMA